MEEYAIKHVGCFTISQNKNTFRFSDYLYSESHHYVWKVRFCIENITCILKYNKIVISRGINKL